MRKLGTLNGFLSGSPDWKVEQFSRRYVACENICVFFLQYFTEELKNDVNL